MCIKLKRGLFSIIFIVPALVDPGKLDIPIAKVGPVNALQLETQSKPNLGK